MDQIPVDIWNHVFEYACSDGGLTGAALSSTSVLFSALSAPYRFHSLKLTSLAQIGKLLLCHERMLRNPSTKDSHRSKRNTSLGARHLLLAFLPGECDAPARPWRGWTEYSRSKHRRDHEIVEDEHAWESSKAAWDRQFEYLVPRLFQLVGPTLETLAVLQHADVALPYAGGQFPRLRELSLLADDHLFVRPKPHWARAAGDPEREELAWFWDQVALFPPFPALTHIHVVYEGPKRIPWEKTLPLWGRLAPEVTHVRVSQASKLMPEVLDGIASKSFAQVQQVDKLRPMGSPPGARKRVSFSKLRRAIVQPLVLEPVRGHEYLEEVTMLRNAPKTRDGPKVVVMRGRWFRDGYWRDRLRWEWEGRMIGGPGCWTEREEDEGEWAYERRKRAEVAVARARMQNLVAGRALSERTVSMIHLGDLEDPVCDVGPLKVGHRHRAILRDLITLGRRSLSR
ncbi:hypothetical protein V8D89_002985 [Ganoderma adspersum]